VTTRVCALDELAPLDPLRHVVGSHTLCIVRIDDDVYVIDDVCTHADVSLSEGEVDPDLKMIECWKHGSQFSLTDGHPDSLPAVRPVNVYTAFVKDGDVFVEVESA
jgi:3-phenylpropionate/trans-cinnamate dioxygenase ferredoxin subunit